MILRAAVEQTHSRRELTGALRIQPAKDRQDLLQSGAASVRERSQWTEADGFPMAGTYVGPQAVLEGVFMRLGEVGDEFAAVPDQIVADGDRVVTLGYYIWKRKSSGERAEAKMARVWPDFGGFSVGW